MNAPTAVVIEDDPDICRLIGIVLQRSGFTVHTAANGPAGVATAQEVKAALITTDMDLPGFSGLEVIRQIRLFSEAPVLVISASEDPECPETSKDAGATAFFGKPFHPRELQRHAQDLLRAAS